MCIYIGVRFKCKKNPRKLGHWYTLFLKKVAYHIPDSAEGSGAIRHAHPYYVIYRGLSPMPPARSLHECSPDIDDLT